jgi:hypothetical protein
MFPSAVDDPFTIITSVVPGDNRVTFYGRTKRLTVQWYTVTITPLGEHNEHPYNQCYICDEKYKLDDRVVVMPLCLHECHLNCLKNHLQSRGFYCFCCNLLLKSEDFGNTTPSYIN